MLKYDNYRDQIQNGDLVLFRGDSALSKTIQNLDNAYYNHIGLVISSNGRNFVLDSNAKGVEPGFLSERMNGYIDFCIIRPSGWNPALITQAAGNAIEKASSNHIRYDFQLLIDILIYRKTGIDPGLNAQNKDICSEFARRFVRFLSPVSDCYEQPNLPTKFITPWDFIVYKDAAKFTSMFDDSDHSKYRKK